MAIKKELLEQIKNLPAIEIFNQGTLEILQTQSPPDFVLNSTMKLVLRLIIL